MDQFDTQIQCEEIPQGFHGESCEANYREQPDTSETDAEEIRHDVMPEPHSQFCPYHDGGDCNCRQSRRYDGPMGIFEGMDDDGKDTAELAEESELRDLSRDHDEPEDGFRDDAEADADTLRSAGMGTDEDYEHNLIDDITCGEF